MSNLYGTCPMGGLWYTCTAQTPTFFGCCASNPCNGVGCPQDDLRAAGMGIGKGPDALVNDSSYYPHTDCKTGKWYTCSVQTPSFQGCCISNPCTGDGGTCEMGNLFPAAFADGFNPDATSSTLTTSTKSTSVVTTSTSVASAMTTSTSASAIGSSTTNPAGAVSTSSPAPLPSAAPGPNIALIAGGTAGGVFAGILALLAIIFCIRKHLKKKNESSTIVAADHSPRPADPFLSKGVGSPETAFNDEAYYPGQYIYGVPPVKKAPSAMPSPTSPAPPAYQSPRQDSNRDTYVSEIDSSTVHELAGGHQDNTHTVREGGLHSLGRGAHGLGLGVPYATELPQ